MISPIVSPLQSLFGSFPQNETSHLLNSPRSSALLTSVGWPPKRIAVDQCVTPQMDQLGPLHASISENTVALPPFPGRECLIDQEGGNDPQSNLLFGVNIDSSSLLMQNEISSLRGVGSDGDSTNIPFVSSNYLSTTAGGTDFSLNPAMTPSSCIDESGFLQSPENVGHANPPIRTFVKVSSPRTLCEK